MKRITKEPWFGKRRLGFGFNPITWQGWVLTLILVLILLLDSNLYLYNIILFGIILIVAIICFIIVALLTSEYLSYPQDEEDTI